MSPSRPLGGALVLVAGVGCATAIVEDEPNDTLPSPGTAAAAGTGGATVAASGGGTAPFGSGAAGASAGGSGAITTCPAPRMPEQPGAAQGNSGSFETTEAVCYFVEGTFNTWNCSNIAGRTVMVNGTRSMCGGSLPEKIDGGYYFEFGAAMDGTTYTSFYWYTS
ncbi:MAG TPA: hypothetical protein VNN72_25550 [Polyangiaceae bacterium]|nr:hypothetical protein [Polyangiaceae bacterium]